MPVMHYKAMDSRGRTQTGQIDAANSADLEMRLGRMGLDLINFREAKAQIGGVATSRVDRREIINFCFQLEQLINAGVPILDGLADLRDSVEDRRLREVIAGMVESIEGGAKYMRKLIDRFEDGDTVKLKDRVRFALGGYNCGPGHIDDARKLAAELGKNPNRWFDNVNQALLLLSKPRYHKKAKYGYARGIEPFKYVSEIQTRYDAYVAVTSEQKPQ